jgi:DNA modification methylase
MINDQWAAEYVGLLNDIGLHRRAWIKWYETFGVNCEANFNRTSRHILYYVVDPSRNVFNRSDEILRPSDREALYADNRAAGKKILDDVWIVPRLCDNHTERVPGIPTQVPRVITDRIVSCATDPGDLVVDPFCGSGTTGASCKQLNRRFIGVERNQEYADLATVRIAAEAAGVLV